MRINKFDAGSERNPEKSLPKKKKSFIIQVSRKHESNDVFKNEMY
jgi:hypothetical protein